MRTHPFPAIACILTLAFCLSSTSSASIVHTLDFEGGQGVGYGTSVAEFSSGSDYFTHSSGGTGTASYGGASGAFFAAQDIGAASDVFSLTLNGLNIAGCTNLTFGIDLAEDDDGSAQDWDSTDFFEVLGSIDGGTQFTIASVINDGSTFNSAPYFDTNNDGSFDAGDVEVTNTFSSFQSAIVGTGSTLDLQFRFRLDSGDEDLAIDNIVVSGDHAPIPEPTSLLMFASVLGICLRRRR